ncbi:hypothetical protein VZT92_022432 [Zoarces viviparus]|uniref:Uncharacterized protein n=1 Tax=Zoarces viviparus TaxID=48416 RepID=A0AAW1EBP9_ZOAVI
MPISGAAAPLKALQSQRIARPREGGAWSPPISTPSATSAPCPIDWTATKPNGVSSTTSLNSTPSKWTGDYPALGYSGLEKS